VLSINLFNSLYIAKLCYIGTKVKQNEKFNIYVQMKKIIFFCFIFVSFLSIAIAKPIYTSAACGPQNAGTSECSAETTATSDESSSPFGNGCANKVGNTCLQDNEFVKDIQLAVNVLSGGVGIVVIGMIILGGVQYSIAGDNATAVTAARQKITNALIARLAFIFTFAFLQWLIPGGVFK